MYYIHLQRWYVKIVLKDVDVGLDETRSFVDVAFSSFQRSAPSFQLSALAPRKKITTNSKPTRKRGTKF